MLLLASVFTLHLNFDRVEIPDASLSMALTETGQWSPLQEGFTPDQPFGLALLPAVNALPFALREFNANCLHNGEIKLSEQHLKELAQATESVKLETIYELTGETCAYQSYDWSGKVELRFTPADPAPAAIELSQPSPLSDAPWQPQPPQQQPTVYGWAHSDADGNLVAHYSTQPGVAVPAYSLSKTFIAANATLLLEQHYPEEILSASIGDYVPECGAQSWQEVTLRDALDMRTGHFNQLKASADESADAMIDNFFLARQHPEKLEHACSYPAQKTGGTPPFVYQSSATYLLATALQNYLNQQPNEPRLDQLLYDAIWRQLDLSPLAYSIDTTKDDRQQVWAGYGLSLLPGDLVKLAQFVQHDPLQLGFADILEHPQQAIPVPGNDRLRYRSSIWFWHDLSNDKWYPFLSGYGGILVLFLDETHLYYLVSDQHDHRFADVIHDFQRWQKQLAP